MLMTAEGCGSRGTHAPATLAVTELLDRTPPACYKKHHGNGKVAATECAAINGTCWNKVESPEESRTHLTLWQYRTLKFCYNMKAFKPRASPATET
jgi:hypothetical protein